MKKVFSIILAITMLFTLTIPSFALSKEEWEKLWESDNSDAGIIMFVGSNESERNFSWYSSSEGENSVVISENKDLSSAETFKGTQFDSVEGSVVNKVTVTGLKENTTYYYNV